MATIHHNVFLVVFALTISIFVVTNNISQLYKERRSLSILNDPKSIISKLPLSPMMKKQYNQDGLRYLIFGSSISWGAAIPNRFDSYPYLLSKDATNLALRANGPNFPSVCTQTMVGDTNVYDVSKIGLSGRLISC